MSILCTRKCMKIKKKCTNNALSIRVIRKVFKVCYSECILMIVVQTISAFFPFLIAISLRMLVDGGQAEKRIYAGLFVLTFLIDKLIQIYFSHYYITYRIMPHFEHRIKEELFERAEKMSMEDYDNAEMANVALRAKNASVNLFRLFQAYVEVIGTIASCAVISMAGLFINWQIVIFLIFIGLASVAENRVRSNIEEEKIANRTQLEKEYGSVVEILFRPNMLKELFVFKAFKFAQSKADDRADSLARFDQEINSQLLKTTLKMNSLIYVFRMIGFGVLFRALGNEDISLGGVAFALTSYLNLTALVREIFDVSGYILLFKKMVFPYFEFVDGETCVKQTKHVSTLKRLELRNVSFKYRNKSEMALRNINLVINEGERVVIVGENGSGKTTLLKVICYLLKPQTGNVLYNNIEISEFSEEDYLRVYTEVPQSINLYPVPLVENITFSEKRYENEIDKMLSNLGLEYLRNKGETIVGKNYGGIELSGGEKQKVAIIRAYIKKACVFVLDEATSAIDPIQEKDILTNINDLINRKTSIIVSHRLSFAKDADRIVVLKNGEIVELGKHSDLLLKRGVYYDMWEAQSRNYR